MISTSFGSKCTRKARGSDAKSYKPQRIQSTNNFKHSNNLPIVMLLRNSNCFSFILERSTDCDTKRTINQLPCDANLHKYLLISFVKVF